MYKINNKAWFFSNPRDFALGNPSDKISSTNDVIILEYNKVLAEKEVKWNKRVLFERVNSHTKADIEEVLNNLPFDAPYELREKVHKYLKGYTDKNVFDSLNDKMEYSEIDTIPTVPMKRFELVLPENFIADGWDSSGVQGLKQEGKEVIDALTNLGFNIKLKDSYWGGSIFKDSKGIKFQINPAQVSSIKDYFKKDIKRGDKVLWAETKYAFYTGEVLDIFPDKIKIKPDSNRYGNKDGFNLPIEDYTFVRI